jgi:hypothetical protein
MNPARLPVPFPVPRVLPRNIIQTLTESFDWAVKSSIVR